MARSRCPICKGHHRFARGNPLPVLKRTPGALARIVQRARRPLLARRPKPREWSVTEVLAHLADAEVAFAFRIRKMISEPRPALPPFDQEAWASALRYRRQDPRHLVGTFRALRESNSRILRSVAPAQRRRAGVHPEYGRIRLGQLVAHWAWHDQNHLNQIRQALLNLAPAR